MYQVVVKNSMLKELESRLLDLCVLDRYFTQGLIMLCEFLSMCFGSNGKKNFITYLLPWGGVLKTKTPKTPKTPKDPKT